MDGVIQEPSRLVLGRGSIGVECHRRLRCLLAPPLDKGVETRLRETQARSRTLLRAVGQDAREPRRGERSPFVPREPDEGLRIGLLQDLLDSSFDVLEGPRGAEQLLVVPSSQDLVEPGFTVADAFEVLATADPRPVGTGPPFRHCVRRLSISF